MIKDETLTSLDFGKVLLSISSYASSPVTREMILDITPLGDRNSIEDRACLVEEMKNLYLDGRPFSISSFGDIRDAMVRVRPEGAILDADDFIQLRTFLTVISDLSLQIAGTEDIPRLDALAAPLTGFPELLELLGRTFDAKGEVVDKASAELYRIRKELKSLSARVSSRLEAIVNDEKVSPFLQDDFITKRGERWVIPVRMDSKGQVSGVVHGVSNTGETAFIEPLEIIGMVNELENLSADEKGEVIRILRRICSRIRDAVPEIKMQFQLLADIDLLKSIAQYAFKYGMEKVMLNDGDAIRLKDAMHPLLVEQQMEGQIDRVVPLCLDIGGGNSVMVVTGPNAGGKTITIKTAGLLLLMALAGIPVPAHPSSSIPLASGLLVDIGDEQSIENSHSTFSAHVTRISKILGETGPGTVVLLDEIGTGTEPLQGAAIACAVLDELRKRGALVLATTHLTDIVAFVQKAEGMINASMEFDRQNHRPLYRLIDGEPGQSHAIEMAGRYGLPESVIAFASKMLGGMNAELQELLRELKEKRQSFEEAESALQRKMTEVDEREKEAKLKLEEAEKRKKIIYEEAYLDMREMIVSAKREIRDIVAEGKKGGGREALKKLEKKRVHVAGKLIELADRESVVISEVKAGDTVFVRSIGYDAKVVHIDEKRGRLRVESGGITVEVSLDDITSKSGRNPKPIRAKSIPAVMEQEIPSSIKLLGLRVEEALKRVEDYIDAASASGAREVKIIHGVGSGAIMKAVREYLNECPQVESFRRGEQAEGGEGVTIVVMKYNG